MSSVMIFRLNNVKGTAEAPTVDLLRLNTLRGTKTSLLTPKRHDGQPCPFYVGFPPLGIAVSSLQHGTLKQANF